MPGTRRCGHIALADRGAKVMLTSHYDVDAQRTMMTSQNHRDVAYCKVFSCMSDNFAQRQRLLSITAAAAGAAAGGAAARGAAAAGAAAEGAEAQDRWA